MIIQDWKNILKILNIDDVVIYFQPIFSLTHRKVTGFEALARGIKSSQIISPLTLFKLAEKNGIKYELDLFCREKAIKAFSKIYKLFQEFFLFLNYDASIIDEGKKAYLVTLSQKYEIPPQNVVIEIIETRVRNEEKLVKFIENYKKEGFLIALDDVGESYSNLKRIAQISPHLIKIDRSLCTNIKNENYFKTIKSLASLSEEIGTFLTGEGIEDKEMIVKCLLLELHFLQGYYLCPPLPLSDILENIIDGKFVQWIKKLEEGMEEFLKYIEKHFQEKIDVIDKYKEIQRQIILDIKNLGLNSHSQIFKKWLDKIPEIEAIYLTDLKGILRTPVYYKCFFKPHKLYEPLYVGDCLITKPYIYYISILNFDSFITKPYLSCATGNTVITFSKKIKLGETFFILCIDVKAR